MITRRSILCGLLAAPVVVRAGLLMPVRPVVAGPVSAGLAIDGYLASHAGMTFRRSLADIQADLLAYGRAAYRHPKYDDGGFVMFFEEGGSSVGYFREDTLPDDPFQPARKIWGSDTDDALPS